MPFVNSEGQVNWGDQPPGEVEYPHRPSAYHDPIGGEWILNEARYLADKINAMDGRIVQRLNDKAAELKFDSIASAILAASLPIGEFRQDDGAKLHLWSARTWQKSKQILDEFLAGQRAEPTWNEVESELPVYPID